MTAKTEKATKTAKTTTKRALTPTEASKVARKSNERKAITANLRKFERIRSALEKASKTISTEGESLQGDTGAQIAEVLGKMTLAITITTSEIESQATALARTFMK